MHPLSTRWIGHVAAFSPKVFPHADAFEWKPIDAGTVLKHRRSAKENNV